MDNNISNHEYLDADDAFTQKVIHDVFRAHGQTKEWMEISFDLSHEVDRLRILCKENGIDWHTKKD